LEAFHRARRAVSGGSDQRLIQPPLAAFTACPLSVYFCPFYGVTPNRSSTEAPGNSTLWATNQAVARSNSTLGRSVPVQHSAYSQRISRHRGSGSVNSR
jgi:hypothetical protein